MKPVTVLNWLIRSLWFDDPVEQIATNHLGDAESIVWIEKSSRVVGIYKRKVLGPITANNTGDALQITWEVWLIDIKENAVTAHEVFIGPDPPKEIEQSGDFGISPLDEVADWLVGLQVH